MRLHAKWNLTAVKQKRSQHSLATHFLNTLSCEQNPRLPRRSHFPWSCSAICCWWRHNTETHAIPHSISSSSIIPHRDTELFMQHLDFIWIPLFSTWPFSCTCFKVEKPLWCIWPEPSAEKLSSQPPFPSIPSNLQRDWGWQLLCCNASGGKIKSKEPKQAGCTNEWGNEENREVHLRDLTYPLTYIWAEGNTETNERIQRGREREWGWEEDSTSTLTQGQRERKVRLTAVKAKRLMKIMI